MFSSKQTEIKHFKRLPYKDSAILLPYVSDSITLLSCKVDSTVLLTHKENFTTMLSENNCTVVLIDLSVIFVATQTEHTLTYKGWVTVICF